MTLGRWRLAETGQAWHVLTLIRAQHIQRHGTPLGRRPRTLSGGFARQVLGICRRVLVVCHNSQNTARGKEGYLVSVVVVGELRAPPATAISRSQQASCHSEDDMETREGQRRNSTGACSRRCEDGTGTMRQVPPMTCWDPSDLTSNPMMMMTHLNSECCVSAFLRCTDAQSCQCRLPWRRAVANRHGCAVMRLL